jgi:RNA polymerase sigma-32 factor
MMTNALILRNNASLPLVVGAEEAYVRMVSAIPVLAPEEELELAKRYRYQEDLEAARKLILSHLRFVVHIARTYQGYGLQLVDLIQEGNIGLMKAVKRFDPEQGVRLVTFAVHWIRAEIHEFVIRNWRLVKVATTKAQRKLFFNLRKARKGMGSLTGEEVKAISRDLDVKPETVREMETRLYSRDVSFDGSVDESEENESGYSAAPSNILADHRYEPQALLEKCESGANQLDQLEAALDSLDARSAEIIRKRWLSDKKSTLHELADELSVSPERVRQLEKNAMKKMQKWMEVA